MDVVSKGQEFFKNILEKLNLKKKAIAFCVENWNQFKSWVKYSLSLKTDGSGYPACPDGDVEAKTIGELIESEVADALRQKKSDDSLNETAEFVDEILDDEEEFYDMYDRLEEEGKVTEAAPDPH